MGGMFSLTMCRWWFFSSPSTTHDTIAIASTRVVTRAFVLSRDSCIRPSIGSMGWVDG